MALSVVNTTQNAARVTGTAGLSITKPADLQDGDVLVAFIGAGDEAGGAYACSGWTALDSDATSTGNDIGSTVLYRVITNAAGEPASYTFTNADTASQNRAGFIIAIRGADTADPIDANTKNTGTNDWTPTHVNITTGVDDALCLFFHVGNIGTAAAKTAGAPATPTGTTLRGSIAQSRVTANYIAAELASFQAGTAGDVTVGAWEGTPDDTASEWHVYSVSINPEAAAATPISESDSGSGADTAAARRRIAIGGATPTACDMYLDFRAGSDGASMTNAYASGGAWPASPPAIPFVYPSSPASRLKIETDAAGPTTGEIICGGVEHDLADVTQGMIIDHDTTASEEVRIELPSSTIPVCSVGFAFKTTLNAGLYEQYGQSGIQGISDADWAILSTYIDASGNVHACLETNGALWPSTPTNGPTLAADTWYWITIQYNRTLAKAYLRVYNPTTWAQVGSEVEADLVASPPYAWCVDHGLVASEGNTDTGAFSYYGPFIVDWTDGTFPLLPGSGSSEGGEGEDVVGVDSGPVPKSVADEGGGGTGGGDDYDQEIAATLDDGYEYSSAWYSNELAAGDAGGGTTEVIGGIRFTGVTIPDGATITNAYIRVYKVNGSGSGTLQLKIRAVLSADAVQFGSGNLPHNATFTTAAVDFDIAMSPLNEWAQSGDISAIIQELVDTYGGLSSAAINIVLRSDGANGQYLYFYDRQAGTSYLARLYIEWTEGSEPDEVLVELGPTHVDEADAGTGADGGAVHAAAAVGEAGSGADAVQVDGATTPKSVADAGAGADGEAVGAKISEADSGAGADADEVTAGISEADAGSGADAGAILAGAQVADAGAGADELTRDKAMEILDAGAGADEGLRDKALGTADTGSGADAIDKHESGEQKNVTDAGAGAEALAVLAKIFEAEAASGFDAIAALARLALADSGSGADAAVAEEQKTPKSVADAGSGAESLALEASVAVLETGGGAEILAILARFTTADIGSGADAVEKREAGDQKAVADIGSGADAVTGLEVTVPASDQGTGAEAVGLKAGLAASDQGAGSDQVVVAEPPYQKAVSDSGSGQDVIEGILAAIGIEDPGEGAELLVIYTGAVPKGLEDIGSGAEQIFIDPQGLPYYAFIVDVPPRKRIIDVRPTERIVDVFPRDRTADIDRRK